MERDRLKVAIQSPYPLRRDSPDGVKEFITGLKPYLEKKGCSVRLIGPHIKDSQNNLADFTLGRPVKISINNTTFQSGISFNKERAKEVSLTIRPDVVVMHEPLVPNSAHTLISAMPKKEDGKALPVIVGQFHARSENIDKKTSILRSLCKFIRTIKVGKKGIRLTKGPERTVMDSLDGIIAVSNATADFWREELKCAKEFRVIYNGVDIDELTPNGPKIETWNDGRKTILFAGRHDPRKGIDYLINAFAFLVASGRRDIKLKITGQGKMTRMLRLQVEKNGLSTFIEFVGNLPRKELIKAYRSVDLLVVPSIGGEGFNRTIAEAKSCGTLVVCTDIEGPREAIGESLAPFMAQPKNAESLAAKSAEIIDLPVETKQRLSKEARLDVERRFAWPIIASRHVQYYQELMNAHGRSSSEDWPPRKKRLSVGKIFPPLSGTVYRAKITK